MLTQLIGQLGALQATAAAVAELDALASLAERACALQWTQPELTSQPRLHIEAGRHPVVEKFLNGSTFVPNDLDLT